MEIAILYIDSPERHGYTRDVFKKCTDLEVTDNFIRFKNKKDTYCFFFHAIKGYIIEEA